MKQFGVTAAVSVIVEVGKFETGAASAMSVVEVAIDGLAEAAEAVGRLEQFPNFPGRQPSQNCFAFTQAQPLQEPAA